MIAIIPAGGKAIRFNGTQKELLPINEGKTLLENALDMAERMGAEYSIIVTTANKITQQMRMVELTKHKPIFVHQTGDELRGAIMSALPYTNGHTVLLLFPDTIFDISDDAIEYVKAFDGADISCIAFGTFKTFTPEKYSVFLLRIITKPKDLQKNEHGYSAYGTVVWDEQVSNFWLAHADEYIHYDDMFNDAREQFCKGSNSFVIENYQDLGTWSAYKTYIANLDCKKDNIK